MNTHHSASRIRISRLNGDYAIHKGQRPVGMIRHLPAGGDAAPWVLLHASGRVDRFDRYQDARDEALKL